MRKLSILISISVAFFLVNCSQKTEKEFLDLNIQELEELGIILNEEGLFYKNVKTTIIEEESREKYFGFFCDSDNYSTIISGQFIDTSKYEKNEFFNNLKPSNKDYNPTFITDQELKPTFSTYPVDKELKLLPIRIFMEKAENANRKDTIIIWMESTEMLTKALPERINIEDYLRNPDDKLLENVKRQVNNN